LSPAERLEILAVLDAPRFVDLPPVQIYAILLDEGTDLCSITTMYRILAEHAQLVERRIARHPARVVPELVATGPGQVYSWDITKLAGPAKGAYYDTCVMIDIYSRYIVGVKVHPHESGQLAADMMAQVFGLHGTPNVVHVDSEYGRCR
jgi:putative transposase